MAAEKEARQKQFGVQSFTSGKDHGSVIWKGHCEKRK